METQTIPFDPRFIQAITQAAETTLSDLSKAPYRIAGAPGEKNPNDRAGDISGVVGFVSPDSSKGSISISFPEATFLSIASKMLQSEFKSITEENADAAAKILNELLNRANEILKKDGLNIQVTLSSTIVGKNHEVGHRSDLPTIVLLFKSGESSSCRIEICSAS